MKRNNSSSLLLVGVAAIATAYLIFKGRNIRHKYTPGDTLRMLGDTTNSYLVIAIVDNKYYSMSQNGGIPFIVEIAVVDSSQIWYKV